MTAILDKLVEATQECEFLCSLTFPLNPEPASRPRFTQFGVYYGKKYETWRQAINKKVPTGQLRTEAPLLIVIDYVVRRPKKPANPYPHPDIDNYDKATLDGITKRKGYYKDDKQVVILFSRKRYAEDGEEPRADVEFYEYKI